MKQLFLGSLFLALTTFPAQSTLLDKVAGVVNDKVYTLSEINRIQDTLPARQEISPLIYSRDSYNEGQILKLLQHRYIIKDKLAEMGFIVSDDSVMSRISETERRLGLSREDLLEFLKSKGISFNEYFELIREAMEYNIFQSRIIAPLVNITEQEIKNFYYNMQPSNTVLSFNYELFDFYLPANQILQSERNQLSSVLEEYQKTGNLPDAYRGVETSELGKVRGDDLPKALSDLLANTDEGSFSAPYEIDGVLHVFFVKAKDLTESQDFLRAKDQIYNELFISRSQSIIANWFSRESLNYYILENI